MLHSQPTTINANQTPFDLSDKNQLSSQRLQAKLMDTPFAKNGSQAETINAKGDVTAGGDVGMTTPVPRASSQSNAIEPKMTDGFAAVVRGGAGGGSSTA